MSPLDADEGNVVCMLRTLRTSASACIVAVCCFASQLSRVFEKTYLGFTCNSPWRVVYEGGSCASSWARIESVSLDANDNHKTSSVLKLPTELPTEPRAKNRRLWDLGRSGD